jgi:UDP-2-acetamido-3-amino-2,3-dideoxy-glucuronate N-acetyltransferase
MVGSDFIRSASGPGGTLTDNQLSDARLIKLPLYVDPGGDGLLVPTEAGKQVPFCQIQRMFTILAPAGAKRGRHAHRLCSQFMLCVSGVVDVVCDDGKDRRAFSLDHPDLALFVPPGLWLEFDARENDSVLTVLCDRLYEEHDHIRDYAEFLSFCKAARA